MMSTNIAQVLPKMIVMFPGLSRTKSMTLGHWKTVSNILIGCLIASNKINTLNDFVGFVRKLWIHTQTQKMLTLSGAMRHLIGMFDTVLERPNVIILVLESPRNIPFILGNTWSTSVDIIVA